jgi:hypothetical protein
MKHQFVLTAGRQPSVAAQNLYKGLHYLDELKLDVLFAEICPPDQLGSAINDRLQRAAHRAAPVAAMLN